MVFTDTHHTSLLLLFPVSMSESCLDRLMEPAEQALLRSHIQLVWIFLLVLETARSPGIPSGNVIGFARLKLI